MSKLFYIILCSILQSLKYSRLNLNKTINERLEYIDGLTGPFNRLQKYNFFFSFFSFSKRWVTFREKKSENNVENEAHSYRKKNRCHVHGPLNPMHPVTLILLQMPRPLVICPFVLLKPQAAWCVTLTYWGVQATWSVRGLTFCGCV